MSAPVLALLGLRCVGKSTLGAALAERMGARFVDLDEVLATREGQPDAGSLLREVGEPRFREAEREALLEVLALAQAEGVPVLTSDVRMRNAFQALDAVTLVADLSL